PVHTLCVCILHFVFTAPSPSEIHTLSLHDALPISTANNQLNGNLFLKGRGDPTLMPEDFDRFAKKVKENGIDMIDGDIIADDTRSEEHTSELQSRFDLVCRLLLEKKNTHGISDNT